MKPISFKYRLIKKLNLYLSKSRQFPECWDEVSEKQFKAFESLQLGEIDDIQFISIFFDLPKRVTQKCTDFLKYSLLEVLEFMKDQKQMRDFLSARQYETKLDISKIKSPLDIMVEFELSQKEIEEMFK